MAYERRISVSNFDKPEGIAPAIGKLMARRNRRLDNEPARLVLARGDEIVVNMGKDEHVHTVADALRVAHLLSNSYKEDLQGWILQPGKHKDTFADTIATFRLGIAAEQTIQNFAEEHPGL